jgi:hypothetical protein
MWLDKKFEAVLMEELLKLLFTNGAVEGFSFASKKVLRHEFKLEIIEWEIFNMVRSD